MSLWGPFLFKSPQVLSQKFIKMAVLHINADHKAINIVQDINTNQSPKRLKIICVLMSLVSQKSRFLYFPVYNIHNSETIVTSSTQR